MDSERDWRGSFSQLAAARERTETSPAADEAVAELRSLAQPPAEAGLILAPPEIAPPSKPKRKPASTAKRPKAPGKRAARKPTARKARPKARTATPRRKPAAKAMADPPAIPLPDVSTPFAEPAVPTQPLAPLPRKASLAPYRKGGLIEAIGFWLRTTARRARAKLGASTAMAKSAAPAGGVSEIDQLRAENEQLRHQLDALLALSDAAQFKFKS